MDAAQAKKLLQAWLALHLNASENRACDSNNVPVAPAEIKETQDYRPAHLLLRPVYFLKKKLCPLQGDSSAPSAPLTPALDYYSVFKKTADSAENALQFKRNITAKPRLALIADTFTRHNLEQEPGLIVKSLHADTALQQLQQFSAELLLIESAWQGLEGSWQNQIAGAPSAALLQIISYCKQQALPVVFWNKEDPLHFEAFIETAKQCDVVLTTDAAMLPFYRRELGHQRVYPWLFAYQPHIYHPILAPGQQRREKGFFAGAWYASNRLRCQQFLNLAGAFLVESGLDIYARNGLDAAPEHRYPECLKPFLHDAVAYEDIAELTRQYRAGLNLNSVQNSPTMFARRILELAGSGVSVYSNSSDAMQMLFAKTMIQSDDAMVLHDALQQELQTPDALSMQQRRVNALRAVLQNHTWQTRLQQLWGYLGFSVASENTPRLHVLLQTPKTSAHWQRTCTMLAAQTLQPHQVLVFAHPWLQDNLPAHWRVLSDEDAALAPAQLMPDAMDFVAIFHGEDAYESNYLLDLTLALRFNLAQVITKAAIARFDAQNGIQYPEQTQAYRYVDSAALRCSLLPARLLNQPLQQLMQELDSQRIKGQAISIDSLSYVQNGNVSALLERLAEEFSDTDNLPLAAMPPQCTRVIAPSTDGLTGYTGSALVEWFNHETAPNGVTFAVKRHRMEFTASTASAQPWYSKIMAVQMLKMQGQHIHLHLDAPSSPFWDMFLQVFDKKENLLQEWLLQKGQNERLQVPQEVEKFRLKLLFHDSGVSYLDAIWLGALALSVVRP